MILKTSKALTGKALSMHMITPQQITSIRFNNEKLKRFAFTDKIIHPEFNF